jgi:hypothetical protein
MAEERVEQADFNGDGVQDTLTVACAGGSAFSGCRVTATDGRTKQDYGSEYHASFGSMLAGFPIPNNMATEPGKGFLKALEKGLGMPKAPVDGSLAWLLDAVTYGRQAHKAGPFAWRGHFTPRWKKGPVVIPENHHVLVGKQRWDLLAKRLIDMEQIAPAERGRILGSGQGWILYFAHNHKTRKVRTLNLSKGGKLTLTAHGVAYERDGRHCWLWVSDQTLAGPDKLRRPSVGKVQMSGGLLFVQVDQGLAGKALMAVNVKTGWFGKLNVDRLSGWRVDKKRLTVRVIKEGKNGQEKTTSVRLKLSDLSGGLQRR